MLKPNAHRPSVSLELLDLRQLHDRTAHVLQSFLGQVRAGDVLRERREIHAGVLLRVAVGRCYRNQYIASSPSTRHSVDLRSEWFTPAE